MKNNLPLPFTGNIAALLTNVRAASAVVEINTNDYDYNETQKGQISAFLLLPETTDAISGSIRWSVTVKSRHIFEIAYQVSRLSDSQHESLLKLREATSDLTGKKSGVPIKLRLMKINLPQISFKLIRTARLTMPGNLFSHNADAGAGDTGNKNFNAKAFLSPLALH